MDLEEIVVTTTSSAVFGLMNGCSGMIKSRPGPFLRNPEKIFPLAYAAGTALLYLIHKPIEQATVHGLVGGMVVALSYAGGKALRQRSREQERQKEIIQANEAKARQYRVLQAIESSQGDISEFLLPEESAAFNRVLQLIEKETYENNYPKDLPGVIDACEALKKAYEGKIYGPAALGWFLKESKEVKKRAAIGVSVRTMYESPGHWLIMVEEPRIKTCAFIKENDRFAIIELEITELRTRKEDGCSKIEYCGEMSCGEKIYLEGLPYTQIAKRIMDAREGGRGVVLGNLTGLNETQCKSFIEKCIIPAYVKYCA